MSTSVALPAGFDELKPFVSPWALADFGARMLARHGATMEALRAFYDAATPRFDDMVAALDGYPLDDLPPPQQTLYNLLMSLAHVAHSIERHNNPVPSGTRFPHAMRMITGLTPA